MDSVRLHILHNALANVASEMALVMLRTAYSTIFNEGRDFTTVIVDKAGDLIAEKCYTPSMLGAIPHTVRWTIEELGEDAFEPGDVIVHNDPYRGGCHLPEHMLIKPVFVEGKLFAFTGVMGHLAEIGGMAPGSFAANATDIFQEGLRLPPVHLIRRGEYVSDTWRIILSNHRTPRFTWGDFHAMIGALNVGEKRLMDLVRKYGAEALETGAKQLMDYSERRMRAQTAALPDGVYEADMYMEDDGVSDDPIHFKVAVTIDGDEIIADWSGSDPQVQGPVNCSFVVPAAAVYNAVFCIADPHSDIPRNSGCYRPIEIVAPVGSVVNVKYPGPCVAGNTETQPQLIDLLFKALAPAAPERIAAAAGGTASNFLFAGVHPETGEYFSNYHFDGKGEGATMGKDGNDAEVIRSVNVRNTPVEVLEVRYPLRQLEYSLVADSGGPGRRRGGLGVRAIYEVLSPRITISAVFDRMRVAPWGLSGGKEGGRTQLLLKRKGDTRFRPITEVAGTRSPTKFTNVVMYQGDQLMYCTPGGGGFGSPLERDPVLVLRDLEAGWISPEAASREYGVEVIRQSDGTWRLDSEATAERRKEAGTVGRMG